MLRPRLLGELRDGRVELSVRVPLWRKPPGDASLGALWLFADATRESSRQPIYPMAADTYLAAARYGSFTLTLTGRAEEHSFLAGPSRRLRVEHKVSQASLAEATGLGMRTIQELERGRHHLGRDRPPEQYRRSAWRNASCGLRGRVGGAFQVRRVAGGGGLAHNRAGHEGEARPGPASDS